MSGLKYRAEDGSIYKTCEAETTPDTNKSLIIFKEGKKLYVPIVPFNSPEIGHILRTVSSDYHTITGYRYYDGQKDYFDYPLIHCIADGEEYLAPITYNWAPGTRCESSVIKIYNDDSSSSSSSSSSSEPIVDEKDIIYTTPYLNCINKKLVQFTINNPYTVYQENSSLMVCLLDSQSKLSNVGITEAGFRRYPKILIQYYPSKKQLKIFLYETSTTTTPELFRSEDFSSAQDYIYLYFRGSKTTMMNTTTYSYLSIIADDADGGEF